MSKDISKRADVELLIKSFYEQLLEDAAMQHLFFEVVKIDLEEHLPFLVDFWENVLLNRGVYRRNVMLKHLAIHELHPLTTSHFDTWLTYFNEAVDRLFAGEKAELAKERARSIAALMQFKIAQMDQSSN